MYNIQKCLSVIYNKYLLASTMLVLLIQDMIPLTTQQVLIHYFIIIKKQTFNLLLAYKIKSIL